MRTKKKEKKAGRAPRRMTVAFEKHSGRPHAIVEGRFVAPKGSTVFAWRLRAGRPPSWYTCEVGTVEERYVMLWDVDAGQWFCFDPSATDVPDVRLSG